MSSKKFKLWDINNILLQEISKSPLIVIKAADAISFKILKEKLFENHYENFDKKVLSGSDIKQGWIEDNFLSLGLFGNSESFLINSSDKISKDLHEVFDRSEEFILDNRFLILNFEKESELLKKLNKSSSWLSVQIQAPAFWENNQLFDFLCQYFGVYLSLDSKEYFLNSVPFNIESYYSKLSQLKLHYDLNNSISLDLVKELIEVSKIDQFKFAELFGQKSISKFYKELMDLNLDYNEYYLLFNFIQSHFLKLYDTSYLSNKSKLTKYDRSLMQQSKLWNRSELDKVLQYLGEVTQLSKTKSVLLESKLKRDYLRTFIR